MSRDKYPVIWVVEKGEYGYFTDVRVAYQSRAEAYALANMWEDTGFVDPGEEWIRVAPLQIDEMYDKNLKANSL